MIQHITITRNNVNCYLKCNRMPELRWYETVFLQTSLDTVRKLLSQSRTLQAVNKMHQLNDWYNINGNYVYIARWSIFTCVVIVITSCVQLIFVRRLFSTSSVTPNAKPRAWRRHDVIVYCCRSMFISCSCGNNHRDRSLWYGLLQVDGAFLWRNHIQVGLHINEDPRKIMFPPQ